MLFRQLLDPETSTYTYLLASGRGGEALIIDPVVEHMSRYLGLLRELRVKLVAALDTHTHADHVTALSALHCATGCSALLSDRAPAPCLAVRFGEGDVLKAGSLRLRAMHTPGHTDDCYSFVMQDRVFTGDALLIGATGRTDFQNGDAHASYRSLFNKLLKLPDSMLVYPGHATQGPVVSTIGEERRSNPRLQVKSAEEYAQLMERLDLPEPRQMPFAMPTNLRLGERRARPRRAEDLL
jgi:sulfur dioxygenase